MPSPNKEKGKRGERGLVNLLRLLGIDCKRTGHKQDEGRAEFADVTLATGEKIEVKTGKQVPSSLYKWIEGQDALAVKRDREDWLLVVRLKK